MIKDMATVMDIMRNNKALRNSLPTPAKKAKKVGNSIRLAVLKLSAISLAFPVMADVKIVPSLSLSTYAYQVEVADGGTDDGLAQAVTPGLDLTYSTPWLKSSFSVDQMALFYKDAQRDNSTYTNYRLNNTASFLRNQLAFQLGANQSKNQGKNGYFSYPVMRPDTDFTCFRFR